MMLFMNRVVLISFLIVSMFSNAQGLEKVIARQGKMSFLSYTSVENIKAENAQVLSFLNPNTGEIAVRVLMRAFKFEKSLMEEHFNESYMESDLYPEANFIGRIDNYDASIQDTHTRLVRGDFTLRGITKPLEFKVAIRVVNNIIYVDGNLEILVQDFDINIPALLSPNIAKKIQVAFNFDYTPYE